MTRHNKRGSTIGIGGAVHGRNDRLIDLFAILEPTQAPQDLTWQDAALCGQIGSDAFYGERGCTNTAARRVCARCPVREDCLTDALNNMGLYGMGRHGVWGSTSPEQRLWLLDQFSGDVQAAVAYAMDQDPAADTVNLQPRKAAAA